MVAIQIISKHLNQTQSPAFDGLVLSKWYLNADTFFSYLEIVFANQMIDFSRVCTYDCKFY